MQPLFSNTRSKAAENHIKLSDTRRATLAWLALLIMRAARSACSRVSGSGNSAIEFRAIAGQAPGTEASKSSFSQPRRRTAHEENRGRSKTGVSLLNLAVVRHDVHDIL
jgi:hypothetical protein